MNEFLQKLAECLDVGAISSADVITDLPEWDSLSVLSVIAMLDSTYKVNLVAQDLRDVKTASDLWDLVQARRP